LPRRSKEAAPPAFVAVTPEEVRRLAALSRLNVTRPEEERLRGELSAILGYFRTVDRVPSDVTDERTALDPALLRPDEVRPSDPEGVLKGVPRRKGRLVRAPRVF
jgi:aspartyl/glutamyl-tRNA(Asn/Gln) amidotransferase C subunit